MRYTLGVCRDQMHTAHDRMNRASICQLANIHEGVDNTGMRASQDNNRPLGRIKKQGLVVVKQVWLPAFRIDKEWAA